MHTKRIENDESLPLIRPEHGDNDVSQGKYLKQLAYETLLNASTGGVNKTSVGLVILICLPLAGVSSIIYYQPNLNSADKVANTIDIPKILAEVVLISGGVVSNFILNAYFSYDVPKTSLNRIKAIAWPGLPKSTLAKINYKPQSAFAIIGKGTLGFIKLSLKAVPVLMSTAQYVSLGVDAGVGDVLLIAQLGAYGLMHWFAVTHFIENWIDKIIDISKKPFLLMSKQAQFESYIQACRNTLVSTYKTNIHNALYTLRKAWQSGNRDSLKDIYTNMNSLLRSGEKNNENQYDLAFDLQLQLLEKAEQSNVPTTHWLKLLPFHILNAVLTKFCYISYDLAVWNLAPSYCVSIFRNQEVCSNVYFLTPFRLLMIFPLPYLATCVVAPANTNKLWNLINHLYHGKYVKPVILQRYPGKVYSIGAFFLFLALFSWGATVSLNETYISDPTLLKAANINTIAYNTYFNGFPIPYVALGFSILSTRLIGKIINLCRGNDRRLTETLQDNTLENFLEDFSSNIDLLETVNFLKQLRNLNDHEKIKVIFGGKEPHEVLDRWPLDKSWIETLDFLVNPTFHRPSGVITLAEKEIEDNDEVHASENSDSIEYTLSRRFFKSKPQIAQLAQENTVNKSSGSWCNIL